MLFEVHKMLVSSRYLQHTAYKRLNTRKNSNGATIQNIKHSIKSFCPANGLLIFQNVSTSSSFSPPQIINGSVSPDQTYSP